PEGVFNLGDVAYKKQDYQRAVQQFETAAMVAKDNLTKAKAYHNLGNTYLDAGQYDKSIEAYKNALRLNPNDMDTKYNLAYAQRMKKENPQQNRQNQQSQNQDKKEQEQQANQKQQQQQAQQQQAQEEQAQQQQAQPKEGQISKEDARRLLEALMQQEQKVQQRIVNKKMPPAEKKKVEKDW
ncbi:MAG TPA: tetratricopeptide repeat protein, partial [Chitinophagales bacterium]|nr:tetratricopeptide repeat protein [Chitinophagales bacterium]